MSTESELTRKDIIWVGLSGRSSLTARPSCRLASVRQLIFSIQNMAQLSSAIDRAKDKDNIVMNIVREGQPVLKSKSGR